MTDLTSGGPLAATRPLDGPSGRRPTARATARLAPAAPLAPAAVGAPVRLRAPRPSRLLASDVLAALAALSLLVTGVWARHGGLAALGDGWTAAWTSLAQITGLYASAAGLVGLVLVARPRSLERCFGLDRLFVWHRYLGEAMAVLVGAHVATSLVAWSAGTGWAAAVADLTGGEPYLAGATVGAVLVGVVTITSLRSIRTHLAYETWYFVHLTAYLGLALAFLHQLTLGGDFVDDGLATALWVAAHVAVLGALLWGRWGRLAVAATRPLRVLSVTPHGPGMATLRLGGPGLEHVVGEAGQFYFLRPLRWGLWWQAHPFSLSAAPTDRGLRFTVKDRGDASQAIARLPVGTRVVVEGPYGIATPDVFEGRKALFVVGGVGVAPARSVLERLGPQAEPVVLYRARSQDDLVHLDEVRHLAARCGGRVHTLVGRTATLAVRDPYGAAQLRAAVPDVAERVALVCGPEALLHAARRGLRAAGVPASDIHLERPWW